MGRINEKARRGKVINKFKFFLGDAVPHSPLYFKRGLFLMGTYLESLQKSKPPFIKKLESYADIHHIPIMDQQSMDLFLTLLKLKKPKKLLEIGTAIGYSAIRIAQTLPECLIVSIDRNGELLEVAKSFISEAGLSKQIKLVHGEATRQADNLKNDCPYDALFIDAAKGQYRHFFDVFSRMVAQEGLVVSDNILFRGMVAGDEEVPKRFQSIVKRLREYNHYLAEHPDFDTTFLPIGDGLAVSVKKA